MRRVGIPELGRMEAHLKELQAENDKLQAELEQTRGLCVSSTAEAKEYVELKMHNAKLQAGVAMWRANARAEAEVCLKLGAENAKLQVVVDAAKKAVKQYGVVYPIPSSGHWAMTELEQAIKEVE